MVFSSAYALPKALHQKYEVVLYFMYYSVLTLSTIFITYTFWVKEFKNRVFISILWNIAVFYNLAFCASLLAIIGQFSQVQVAILITSLVTISILMCWQVALLMIIGGVVLSVVYYKTYIDINPLSDYMNDLQFSITYSLLLVSAILIAFLKPKQQYQELTEGNNAFLSNKYEYLPLSTKLTTPYAFSSVASLYIFIRTHWSCCWNVIWNRAHKYSSNYFIG
jgi:hypothetical protein